MTQYPPPVLEERVKTPIDVPNRQAGGLQGNCPLTWVDGGCDKNHMERREERRVTYLLYMLARILVSRSIDYHLAVKTTCGIRLLYLVMHTVYLTLRTAHLLHFGHLTHGESHGEKRLC